MTNFLSYETNNKCDDEQWSVFVLSALVSYVTFFVVVCTYHCVLCKIPFAFQSTTSDEVHLKIEWSRLLRHSIKKSVRVANIIEIFYFFLSCADFISYVIEASIYDTFEICVPFYSTYVSYLKVFNNMFFFICFCLRFNASTRKIRFMLEVYTIVDFMTVPTCFVSIYMDRYWIGLYFFRGLRLLMIPDILSRLHFNRLSRKRILLEYIRYCSNFFALSVSAAGFLHLIENMLTQSRSEHRYLLEFMFFIFETISTVGFGHDLILTTFWSRLFICLVLMIGIMLYTSRFTMLKRAIHWLQNERHRYVNKFGEKHIILCGNISFESVSNLLEDFVHKDRKENNIVVIILHTDKAPEAQLRTLLKKRPTRLKYVCGSAMNSSDLKRVKMQEAAACLVLTKREYTDPDTEDVANIMRVVSIKNFHPTTRVIVQILLHKNKQFLYNVPSWNWQVGDDVVCMSEIELNLIAQSCCAKGISTLIANLLAMRSDREEEYGSQWETEYYHGACMEIYTEYFSPFFNNLSFAEAAAICFQKLKLLLIGVEVFMSEVHASTLGLKTDINVRISPGCLGIFIAKNYKEVRRASFYCANCHDDIKDVDQFKQCQCPNAVILLSQISQFNEYPRNYDIFRLTEAFLDESHESVTVNSSPWTLPLSKTSTNTNSPSNSVNMNINPELTDSSSAADWCTDSTGMFYWCETRPIESCLLDDSKNCFLKNHIVVCISGKIKDQQLDLSSFVRPLRASNIDFKYIRHILFVGSFSFIQREWDTLCNFPEISILSGNPSKSHNLRLAKVESCHRCVILSANKSCGADMKDKDAVICSLNLRGLVFDELLSKKPNLTVKTLIHYMPNGTEIPQIIHFSDESNVKYLDSGVLPTETQFHQMQAFASGTVTTQQVFDSITCSSFFNYNALSLIRNLITGGSTHELEMSLAEGLGMQKGENSNRYKNRPRLTHLSLMQDQLRSIVINGNYEDLFMFCLHQLNILCIGIYRCWNFGKLAYYHDSSIKRNNINNPFRDEFTKRYVITNPPPDFKLRLSDKVFVIADEGCEKFFKHYHFE